MAILALDPKVLSIGPMLSTLEPMLSTLEPMLSTLGYPRRDSIPIVPISGMVPRGIQCSLRYGGRRACARAAARVRVRAETNRVAVLSLALVRDPF